MRALWFARGAVTGFIRHRECAYIMHAMLINVYSMRMGRVNITVPDHLIARARAAGLNVSRVTADALAEELERLEKIQGMRGYLAELEAELGPPSDEELLAAREWADAAFPDHPNPSPLHLRGSGA